MADTGPQEMTKMLKDWRSGDQAALKKMEPIIYQTLKKIAENQMRKEKENHTLQATVLVNDAYMQLMDGGTDWVDSVHFRAISATIMRRTLIDHARSKNAQKRGGDQVQVTLMESQLDSNNANDILELDQVLNKLAEFDERKAKAIELTFFGGMSYGEVGEILDISKATVERELRIAKAWLHRELSH